MKLALVHARAETMIMARYPAYALPTIAFPGVLMLVFGSRFEQGEPDRLLAGFAATALLTVTFFQFGVGIATARTTPWETYLRTLPVSATTRLAGRVLSALVFAAATVGVVTIVGAAVYGTTMSAWRFAALALGLLLGSIPFALLGIAFGYWLPPRAALPVANLAFLPLAIGGALWARPDGIPRDVDLASQVLPTRSWIEVLDSIATGDHPLPLHHVAALAAWASVLRRAGVVRLPPRRRRALHVSGSPDCAKQGGDVSRLDRPGVGLRAPGGRRRPPRPRRAPPRVRRSLAAVRSLRAARAPRPERRDLSCRAPAPNRADRLRHGFRVEAERRRKADGVHRALRKPVAPAEHLCHRVREAEPRLRERERRAHGALEQARPPVDPVGACGDDRERVRDRRGAGIRVALRRRRARRGGSTPRRSARARSSPCPTVASSGQVERSARGS